VALAVQVVALRVWAAAAALMLLVKLAVFTAVDQPLLQTAAQAQCVLFTAILVALHAHFHQQIQGICDEFIYSLKKWTAI
jgi:hypothetical protein